MLMGDDLSAPRVAQGGWQEADVLPLCAGSERTPCSQSQVGLCARVLLEFTQNVLYF